MPDTLQTQYGLAQLDQTRHYDALVVGGGVVGLWLAKILAEEGLDVVLADKGACGSGGSGGLMGALLPHMPSGWNDKKQFQFESLAAMPALIGKLESQAGLNTGYRRCGRVSPIRKPGFLRQTESHAKKHDRVWNTGQTNQGQNFIYEHISMRGFQEWVEPSYAPLGLAHETLSGRVNPRDYMEALRASVAEVADIVEGFDFSFFDEGTGQAHSKDGKYSILAGKLVLSAGYQSFELLKPFVGEVIGQGVKGQAALFELEGFDNYPVTYDDGIYIVPHENGLCAIGSTSEKIWDNAHSTDYGLEKVIRRAKQLCPALRDARLVDSWAGVRPRCDAKDPLVGKLPGKPVYVATGGFKITLGTGHYMARALCDIILERPQVVPLPSCYTMAYHLEKMEERGQKDSDEDSDNE